MRQLKAWQIMPVPKKTVAKRYMCKFHWFQGLLMAPVLSLLLFLHTCLQEMLASPTSVLFSTYFLGAKLQVWIIVLSDNILYLFHLLCQLLNSLSNQPCHPSDSFIKEEEYTSMCMSTPTGFTSWKALYSSLAQVICGGSSCIISRLSCLSEFV